MHNVTLKETLYNLKKYIMNICQTQSFLSSNPRNRSHQKYNCESNVIIRSNQNTRQRPKFWSVLLHILLFLTACGLVGYIHLEMTFSVCSKVQQNWSSHFKCVWAHKTSSAFAHNTVLKLYNQFLVLIHIQEATAVSLHIETSEGRSTFLKGRIYPCTVQQCK